MDVCEILASAWIDTSSLEVIKINDPANMYGVVVTTSRGVVDFRKRLLLKRWGSVCCCSCRVTGNVSIRARKLKGKQRLITYYK